MGKIWLNGNLVEETEAGIPLQDAGLLHGAGVFTTMRAYRGHVFALQDHLARVRRSCEALAIPLSLTNEQLAAAVNQVIAANSLANARIRLTITRGLSTRIRQQEPGTPNVFIVGVPLEPYPQQYYERGITVVAYEAHKLNPYDIQAGHKTLDYFSRLAGLRDAISRGAGEALWFNVHNYLQSATMGNVFIVKGGTLITPPTQDELEHPDVRQRTPYDRSNVLPGITRKHILSLASQNQIPVQVGAVTVNNVLQADEVFMSNSIMEIMPICRIERKPVGIDEPGHLTRKIAVLYRSTVDAFVQGAMAISDRA